jgi:pyrroloquinoline quinone biosynthesis protein B
MLKFCLKLIFMLIVFSAAAQNPFVLVLGVTQDGGFPHIGCTRECCTTTADSAKQMVVSLAVADPTSKKWWLLEATPDIAAQLNLFKQLTAGEYSFLPDGIFVSHAHMGHYTGLMYLGREAMGAKALTVYVLPKMLTYLKSNGPWSQLVTLNNISLKPIAPGVEVKLSNKVSITAFTVPHRDEFSETAGFRINTSHKKYIFIPDIDKWQKWNRNIVEEVKSVDVALLDATFYSSDELPGRDIKEVPHPLVIETLSLFSESEARKIYFIHFNHTNPLLWDRAKRSGFLKQGYSLAIQGARL